MRHTMRYMSGTFAILLAVASTAYSNVPSMEVTVFDSNGHVAFTSSTSPDGSFVTPRLNSGRYVVQFKARSEAAKGAHYLAVVSAGKRKVVATSVAGETFTGGGAAMRLDVDRSTKISGQVANEQAMFDESGSRTRVVGGQRFVWVTAQLGSHLGGHWVEASLAPAQNTNAVALDSIHKIQEHASEGSLMNLYQKRHRF